MRQRRQVFSQVASNVCVLRGFCGLFAVIVILQSSLNVNGHGRLMEPPNRSSLFRYPEFEKYQPEENWDDNQLWCGGLTKQLENGGKCGPCGDDYADKRPRENENGGRFGRGIIARTYKPGQTIPVAVELTQHHKGHFEFSLCPLNSELELEQEECFAKYPLPLADGSGLIYNLSRVPEENGFFNTTVKLPPGLSSQYAVLRWHYKTGNRWDNKTGILGEGDQEVFRGCADVSIGSVKPNTPRPPTHNLTSSGSTMATTIRTTTTTTRKPLTGSTPKPIVTISTTRKPGTTPFRPSPTMSISTAKPTGNPGKPNFPMQRPPKPAAVPVVTTTSRTTTSTQATTTTMKPKPTTTTTTVRPSSPSSIGTPSPSPASNKPQHPMMHPPGRPLKENEVPKNKLHYYSANFL